MVKHRKALFLSNTVTETYDAESAPEMMDIDVEDNGWQDAVEDRGYVDPSADERNYQPFQTAIPPDDSNGRITDDLFMLNDIF